MRHRAAILILVSAVGCSKGGERVAGDEFSAALSEALATSDVYEKRRALERAAEAARGRRIRSRDCVLLAGLGDDATEYSETMADAALSVYDAVEQCGEECQQALTPAYNGTWHAHSMVVRAKAFRLLLYRHTDSPLPFAEAASKDRDSLVRAAAYQWLLAYGPDDQRLRWAIEANEDPSRIVREIAPVLAYPDLGVADSGAGDE